MSLNGNKLIAIAVIVLAMGCTSKRWSAVPMVNDIGADVSTRDRYRLSCVYKGEKSETVKLRGDLLASCYPSVFSDNGLPIVLRIQFNKFESFDAWTTLLSLCSLSVIPSITHWETTFNCAVELAEESDGKVAFDLVNVLELANSFSPSGFFVYTDDKKVPGRRVFSENRQYIDIGGSVYYPDDFVGFVRNNVPFRRALAYAVAVKIKELEDSGRIDAMLGKKGKQRSSAPQHNVIRLDRESKGGYSFVVDMIGSPANKEAAVQAVLNEFAESVKEEYKDAFPGADAESLSVAFPESKLKIEGERISGCAVVLTIKPLSLTYDPRTRRGKISVRFNPDEREEARAWVKKNIETLSRDKNIALVTGQLPPAATYYSLGEKVDGNVMEVEFKTE